MLHTLKAKAVSAVALVGILPIYVAVFLGAVVFPLDRDVVKTTLLIGLCLPFLAGLWGTRSLYVGFAQRCDLDAGRVPREPCLLSASSGVGVVRLLHGRRAGDDRHRLAKPGRLTCD